MKTSISVPYPRYVFTTVALVGIGITVLSNTSLGIGAGMFLTGYAIGGQVLQNE